VPDVLGLLEHVLGERPAVQTGRGDRADLVEVLHVQRLGELQRMPRALDIGDALGVDVGGQVVDGGEMEEVLDVPAEPVDVLLADP
jgi:hypothetical protein